MTGKTKCTYNKHLLFTIQFNCFTVKEKKNTDFGFIRHSFAFTLIYSVMGTWQIFTIHGDLFIDQF